MTIRTVQQALKEAQRRWGAKALVEAHKLPSSAESRAAAHAECERLKAELGGDRKNWTAEQRKVFDHNRSVSLYYRFSVGKAEMGLFFAVKGYGDSWDAAFNHAEDSQDLYMHLPAHFTQHSAARGVFKPSYRFDVKGRRVYCSGHRGQFKPLLADAKLYAAGGAECDRGLKASARAVLKALAVKGLK